MCRWLAYSGSSVLLADLLYGSEHSLIVQSLHARLGNEETNGDGFGIGWYGEEDTPAVFRGIEAAWNDRLLPRALLRPRGRPAGSSRARRRPDRGGRRASPSSLFYSTDVTTLHRQHPDNPMLQGLSDEARLVVSEPLGELAGAWNEVTPSSWGVVQAAEDELRNFEPNRR